MATRKICPQVRTCEEWLRTGGVALINKAAYVDNFWFRLSQSILRVYIRIYGIYLSFRSKWITPPPPPDGDSNILIKKSK